MLGTLLLLLPMAVGALVMRMAGAPTARWGVHLAVGAVGGLLFLALGRVSRLSTRAASLLAATGLAVIAATFASSADIDGVQRWLALGAFRINPSALLGPALIVFAISRLERTPWHAHAVFLCLAAIHLAQPDAGQATACSMSAIVLTLSSDRRRWLLVPVYAAFVVGSWLRPDPLAPAPFVEDIVSRAFALSPLVGVVAVASSLLAVLAPVATIPGVERPHAGRAPTLGLTTYFAIALLVPAFGEFPVPLLGFGSSPALGAFLGVAALRRWCRSARVVDGVEPDEAAPPSQDAQRAVPVLS